jgi:predicted DNA-binding transcriptional regulator AlpA
MFFDRTPLMASRKKSRWLDRHAEVLLHRLEAHAEPAMQPGSAPTPAPARAPRTTRRSTARKPAAGDDGDGGEPAPRSHVRPLLYSLDEVAQAVSLSTGNIQKLVREGSFPKPRAMSARRVGWVVSEIEEWVIALPIANMLPPVNAGQRRAA